MTYEKLKCSTCKKYKRYNAFALGNRPEGRQYRCRLCTTRYDKDHYKKVATDLRHRQLERIYGLTLEDYKRLYNKQEGKCAICKTFKNPQTFARGSRHTDCLFVDHNHKTGKVRGLLCHKCNFGLGYFQDSSHLLQQATSYLEENAV